MLCKAPWKRVPVDMMLGFRLLTSSARAHESGQPRPPLAGSACPASPPRSAVLGPRARGEGSCCQGVVRWPRQVIVRRLGEGTSLPGRFFSRGPEGEAGEAPRGRQAPAGRVCVPQSAPGHPLGPTAKVRGCWAGDLTCSPVSRAAGSAAGHGFRFGIKLSPLVSPGNVPRCHAGEFLGIDRPSASG